ncbi:hypothetical protein IKH83_03545 [Candidatus Saccharibacteria bacterium]|nr:hypothetical protein [Candidatus Saccharibacteria bacterium]
MRGRCLRESFFTRRNITMKIFERINNVVKGHEYHEELEAEQVRSGELEEEENEDEGDDDTEENDPDDPRPDIEDIGKGPKSNGNEKRPNVEDINKDKGKKKSKKKEESEGGNSEGEKPEEEKPEEEKPKEESEGGNSEGEKPEEKKPEGKPSEPLRAWTVNNTVLQAYVNEEVGYKLLGWREAFILADELGIDRNLIVYRDIISWRDALGKDKWIPKGDAVQTLEEYIEGLRPSQLPQLPDAYEAIGAYIALKDDTVSMTQRGQTIVFEGVPANNGNKKILNPITWSLGENVLKKITPKPPRESKAKGFEPIFLTVTMVDDVIVKIARDESNNYLGDFIS